MHASNRVRFLAVNALAAFAVIVPQTRAGSLTITSTPPGATIEIDGAAVGVTPYTIDYPSSYFHKPHTVFGSRLEHALTLRIYKDGYSAQQLKLTEGPLPWLSLTGRHEGSYFLLKADHFDFKLEAVSEAKAATAPSKKAAPIGEPASGLTTASLDVSRAETSSVVFTSEPIGAEIYIDGKFVGQTPATIAMPAGSHVVVVKASGRRDWERDLNVLKNSQVALHPVLELRP
jgi:serine protease Do